MEKKELAMEISNVMLLSSASAAVIWGAITQSPFVIFFVALGGLLFRAASYLIKDE